MQRTLVGSFLCRATQKAVITMAMGSTSSSSSSRADNYNAYHKLAVAVAEVWGSAIHDKNSIDILD